MLVRDLCIVESNNYNKNEKWEYFNYLDTGSLSKNNIELLQFIKTEKELPSRAKQKVDINDILYSSVRPIQEHYGFIDKEYNNLLVSTGFIVLKSQKNKINPKYLYYFLTQRKITNQLQAIAQNSTSSYPSITKDDLLNLEIDLPPLEIQNKIASILSSIDDQVERNDLMVKKLQVLSQGIFNYNFFNSNKDKDKLREIANLYQPETITTNELVANGSYYVYGSGGIIGKYDKYNHIDSQLMISCRGLCGNVSFSLPYSWIIGNQMVIKTQNDDLKYYLYCYFNLIDLKKVETGSVQKQITRANLENLEIEIMSDSKKISKLINYLKLNFNKINSIILENERLIQLKEKLLPLLINGQLI